MYLSRLHNLIAIIEKHMHEADHLHFVNVELVNVQESLRMWSATAMVPIKEALQDVTLAGKYKVPKVCRSWLDVHIQS
jgi:hypothetical protein